MDLGFLLDVNSNNFRRDEFSNVLNSIKSTYAPFVIGDEKTRIGVLAYDEHIHTMIAMGQYSSQQSLDIALDELVTSTTSGDNLLGRGLAAVKSQLFYGKPRPEVPKILVVISGGKSKDDVLSPSKELKGLNVTIFCIGVGQNVDRSELEAIATLPAVSHVVMATISHRETAGGNLASRIEKGKKKKQKNSFPLVACSSPRFFRHDPQNNKVPFNYRLVIDKLTLHITLLSIATMKHQKLFLKE